MVSDIAFTSAAELARKIRQREYSPVEVVDACLERIERRNPERNAFVTVLNEEARAEAREAEEALESGATLGPLHGVPVAIKDLLGMKAGVPNSFGSKPLEDFVPPEDSLLVKRLEAAGAIIVGKTNTPELGHKGHTDNKVVGATTNPFDSEKSVGGSSGGSAAALADGLVPIAQGSDGGGSVRIPAALCGVVGFKPTPGRIPNTMRPDGFMHFNPYLHLGPMARTVEDTALLFEVMGGYSPADPRSLPDEDTDYVAATRRDIGDLRIAYSPDLDVFPVEEKILDVVEEAVSALEITGATVEEVDIGIESSLDELRDAWLMHWYGTCAELAEEFKHPPMEVDYLGEDRAETEPEVVEFIERGLECTAVEERLSNINRTELFDTLQALFAEFDLLVTPTAGVTAFDTDLRFGPDEVDGEQIDSFVDWTLTWPFNQTPHPAMSVPAGLSDDGLPVGLQIVGPQYDDDVVFAAGGAFERVRPWADFYPQA